ncbi:MAG: DUF4124 domain-containing protein [Pseudomonadota bacterium]
MKWLPVLLLLFASALHAAVYKHVNEAGEVIYSDTPTPGAEKMDLPELPIYTPPPVPLIKSRDAPVESDIYRSLEVIKPKSNSTVRNNLGIIELQLRIEPALKVREKHMIQFYLDSERYGPLVDKTAIMMSNIDRGDHTLSASVFDKDGNEIVASAIVTIHLKRESRLQRKDRFVPQPPDPDNPPPVNPGNRDFNPNIRTPNPNIRSNNPNIVSPPPTATPLPAGR